MRDGRLRMLAIAILLLGGGGAAIWAGVRNFQATYAESASTPLSMNTLDRYGGQRWLTIKQGVFLTDQAVVRDLPRGHDNTEDQVILNVPLVPGAAELQREEWLALVLTDIIDLHDIGMLQARDRFRLLLEA
jgi:hypothetical protein